jgi:hypothetical protein
VKVRQQNTLIGSSIYWLLIFESILVSVFVKNERQRYKLKLNLKSSFRKRSNLSFNEDNIFYLLFIVFLIYTRKYLYDAEKIPNN